MILKSEKIKNFLSQKKNITVIYIIVIIGVIMLSLPSFFEKSETPEQGYTPPRAENMAKEIENILSEIYGVGKCRVMVTYKNKGEYVTAKDINESESTSDKKNLVIGSGRDEKPFIIKEIMPEFAGVVVVCRGGENTKVKKDVIAAVCALTGLPENKVRVFRK